MPKSAGTHVAAVREAESVAHLAGSSNKARPRKMHATPREPAHCELAIDRCAESSTHSFAVRLRDPTFPHRSTYVYFALSGSASFRRPRAFEQRDMGAELSDASDTHRNERSRWQRR